ncbi:hypothetical protein M2163_001392 [Streptomyces sp. SAI-135]|uniref:ferritin-like domain-containing protein n=1 Tax=unclassified Streptomyces TaxID=2593676 RepID=UPI00247565CF|nr:MULTISPECIES: DUF2202 domain-containing protein [unclassified Streptomyces]MDH6521617.1 hypothetical protein [Streptomyces sp. SAI-090]MDH6614284.1 hypothetical protein [Streptomyces sp. SAI-135]
MKRNIKIATAVIAGALAIGAVLTVAPVTAGTGGAAPTAAQTMSQSMMTSAEHQAPHHGDRWDGIRRHEGPCDASALADQGTLTASQKATLSTMAEEEKLAHDLYTAFAARYDVRVFQRIAAAETRHLTVVRTLLDRYDVSDPTAGKPAGEFTDPGVQATYDRLLTQGEDSLTGALNAGRAVESDDIAALTRALSGLTAPDTREVYTHLLAASERHLTAFEHWAADEQGR